MPTLDFVEDVAIWTFAGLLAISGTPAAAIAFLTVAPSFVVAMRSGNLGGIITWYVDGDIAAVVDTHSDTEGIIRRTLVGDPASDTHQIYAVKDDSADTIAEIVRKELTEDEARPVGTRYNEDCSCVQTLVDGTWIDNPPADPRTSPAYQYPPPSTSDPACDASARIVAAIGRILTTMTTAAGVIEAVNAIIAVIAVFFPPVALFIALLFALVNAANAIGFAAVALAFDDPTYNTIKCIIDQNIGADGQFDATEWDNFQTAIGEQFGIGIVTAVLSLMFNGIGMVGFNNMASAGTETGDCSTCGWCYFWDFTLSDGGWTPIGVTTYSAGVGFIGADAGSGSRTWAYISKSFTASFITQIHMTYCKMSGSGGNNSTGVNVDLAASNVFSEFPAGGVDCPGESDFTPNVTGDEVFCNVNAGNDVTTVTITRVALYGTGINPFGVSNC